MPGVPPIPVEAWTGPLGLESTPELFIWHLVLVFRECYRVLRDDGVMWCIIGDSFCNNPGNVRGGETLDGGIPHRSSANKIGIGLQQGDLVGIPGRLQFALQAAGWIVRNDNVWHKKNPMPESVSGQRWERCRVKVSNTGISRQATNKGAEHLMGADSNATWQPCPGCHKCEAHGGYVLRRGSWRHTRAHETVLMCVKSMGYWADQEVVREINLTTGGKSWDERKLVEPSRRGPNVDDYPSMPSFARNPAGRNPRSVLTPKPESWSGPHYAAFPTSLISPLIRATCPSRCCPVCGAGWSPVVERSGDSADNSKGAYAEEMAALGRNSQSRAGGFHGEVSRTTLGYRPSCDCGREDWRPGIVLDPFLGSGTTLQVARELMLNGVGLDLAHTYLDEQAKVRAQVGAPAGALDDLPLFNLGIDNDTQNSV
jgi:DNA modification methylase